MKFGRLIFTVVLLFSSGFSRAACVLTAGQTDSSGVASANLQFYVDDQADFYLNGHYLGSCGYGGNSGCWKTLTSVSVPVADFITTNPACNLLAVSGTAADTSNNGDTWLLAITFNDGCQQWVESDGQNTAVDYAPPLNPSGTPGPGPANWTVLAGSETGWYGPYTSTGGLAAAWKTDRQGRHPFRNRTAILSLFGATPPRLSGYDSRPGYMESGQKAESHSYQSVSACRNLTCMHKMAKECDASGCFQDLDVEQIIAHTRSLLKKSVCFPLLS